MADVQITAALKKEIDGLRKPFASFVAAFGALSVTREELAPKLIKAYGSYLAQVGGTFVDFVRVLDSSVPADRTAYRVHKAYMAADYLRRLVSRRDTGGRAVKPVRSNLNMLARLLATLVPLVKDSEGLWSGLATELSLKPRQVSRLRAVVASVQPLIELKLKPIQSATVIHMPTVEEREAVAAMAARKSSVGQKLRKSA